MSRASLRIACRGAATALAAAVVVLAAGAAPARASEYGLPQLISRPSSSQQPNGPVQQLAISPGGRYVLYRTDAPNLAPPGAATGPGGALIAGGIYRYDTVTGISELAAYDYFAFYNVTPPQRVGAENASISADGRWVLFDSDCLLPGDAALPYGNPHRVYLRDMNAPLGSRSSYRLPLGANVHATAVPVHGLSADGTRLLWRTDDYHLTAYWTDTVAGVTRPVSVAYDPASDTMNPNQVLTDVNQPVLSSDGTTVAWGASDMTKATPTVPGEAAAAAKTGPSGVTPGTAGVLWRRVADGDRARTRRVTSPFDAENPSCTAATPATVDPAPPGPCDNPQLDTAAAGSGNPIGSIAGLSDDGQRVAVLAAGHARGSGLPATGELYVVTMFPTQDRADATRPLTRRLPIDGYGNDGPASAPILAATISGNGRYVAFVTKRVLFPFGPPTLIGDSSTVVGVGELYVADLQAQTLQLLSRTPTGAKQDAGPVDTNTTWAGGVTDPAMSADGSTIAFISSADNLVPGDANGLPDAFIVRRAPASAGSDQTGPEVEQLPPVAPDLSPAPDWSLLVDGVTAHRDGTVTLTVETPAAGQLSAGAADGGRMLAAARAATSQPGPVTLTLIPHVTGADGYPGVRRTRATLAALRFTPTDPAAGGPIDLSLPVAFELPRATLSTRVRAMRAPGVLRVSLDAPGPGRVDLVVTGWMHSGRLAAAVRLVSVSMRARHAGQLQRQLRAVPRVLRRLSAGRLGVRVRVSFTPAQAGPVPPLSDTLSAVIQNPPTGR